uniref:ATP synthase peripheral stalk subunit F6, mitochondrial n=1 Tax=Astyanax mexicanus TaxID=7994 RepID=W5KYW1_ASTMX
MCSVWWNRRRKRPAVEAGFLHTPGMAAPFLRVGRLSEQRLRLESSFGILRGRPSVMEFCTKSGNPNKPVRYTSIKKAKPKTIIDIGKLILQKTSDTKSTKQSVIAEAAMKAATKTAKHPALKQSAISSDSVATTPKVATAASSSVQVTPVAATTHCDSLKNETHKVSGAEKTLATSSSTAEDLFDTTAFGEQGNVPVKEGHKRVPAPTATKNLAPEVSSSSDFSGLATSFKGRTSEPESNPDERASPLKATSETDSGAVPVPIDVTYSEEVNSVDEASTEPSVGVLSATGTVTTEMVNSQSVGAVSVDIPVTPPEVYSQKHPHAGHDFSKPTQVPEGAEIIRVPKGSASVPTSTFEDALSEVNASRAQIQECGQLSSTASSSKTFTEERTVASVSTLEIREVAPLVPHDYTIVEETGLKKMSSSDASPEKAIMSDFSSNIIPVERANQQPKTEIPEHSTSHAEEKSAMAKVSLDQDPDPTNEEFADEELTTDKAGVLRDSEAHLDPIKRLFLDKIREYSTKSKAHDGLVDAGPEYEREFSEELAKLQRLYGNGDLTAFPEFEFPEPVLDEFNPK